MHLPQEGVGSAEGRYRSLLLEALVQAPGGQGSALSLTSRAVSSERDGDAVYMGGLSWFRGFLGGRIMTIASASSRVREGASRRQWLTDRRKTLLGGWGLARTAAMMSVVLGFGLGTASSAQASPVTDFGILTCSYPDVGDISATAPLILEGYGKADYDPYHRDAYIPELYEYTDSGWQSVTVGRWATKYDYMTQWGDAETGVPVEYQGWSVPSGAWAIKTYVYDYSTAEYASGWAAQPDPLNPPTFKGKAYCVEGATAPPASSVPPTTTTPPRISAPTPTTKPTAPQPAPNPGSIQPGPAAPAGTASFANAARTVTASRNGTVTYGFEASPYFRGSALLQSDQAVASRVRRRLTLGRATFVASRVGAVKVNIKLSNRNLRTLQKLRHLQVRLTVTVGGHSFVNRFTLKAPKARPRTR